MLATHCPACTARQQAVVCSLQGSTGGLQGGRDAAPRLPAGGKVPGGLAYLHGPFSASRTSLTPRGESGTGGLRGPGFPKPSWLSHLGPVLAPLRVTPQSWPSSWSYSPSTLCLWLLDCLPGHWLHGGAKPPSGVSLPLRAWPWAMAVPVASCPLPPLHGFHCPAPVWPL